MIVVVVGCRFNIERVDFFFHDATFNVLSAWPILNDFRIVGFFFLVTRSQMKPFRFVSDKRAWQRLIDVVGVSFVSCFSRCIYHKKAQIINIKWEKNDRSNEQKKNACSFNEKSTKFSIQSISHTRMIAHTLTQIKNSACRASFFLMEFFFHFLVRLILDFFFFLMKRKKIHKKHPKLFFIITTELTWWTPNKKTA